VPDGVCTERLNGYGCKLNAIKPVPPTLAHQPRKGGQPRRRQEILCQFHERINLLSFRRKEKSYVISTKGEIFCHFDERRNLLSFRRKEKSSVISTKGEIFCHFDERRNLLSFRRKEKSFVISTKGEILKLVKISPYVEMTDFKKK
jgi:hypothetical protein